MSYDNPVAFLLEIFLTLIMILFQYLIIILFAKLFSDHDNYQLVILIDGNIGHVGVLKIVELELNVLNLISWFDRLDFSELVSDDLLKRRVLF